MFFSKTMQKLSAKISSGDPHGIFEKEVPRRPLHSSPLKSTPDYMNREFFKSVWQPWIWHLFTGLWVVYLESSFTNWEMICVLIYLS